MKLNCLNILQYTEAQLKYTHDVALKDATPQELHQALGDIHHVCRFCNVRPRDVTGEGLCYLAGNVRHYVGIYFCLGLDKEDRVGGKYLCRDNALVARSVVYSSRICGSELNTVLEIKYHAVDRVGILVTFNSVKHYLANGDLAVKALAARFCLNYAGEPIYFVAVIKARAAEQL